MTGEARLFVPVIRAAVGSAGVIALVVTAIVVGPALERRGLPGAAITAGVLVLVAAWSVKVVWRQQPVVARWLELRRFAAGHGHSFTYGFVVPRSMYRLRSLSEPSGDVKVRNLLTVRNGSPVLVFDRSFEPHETYRTVRWRTVAAVDVRLDAPVVRIEPEGWMPPLVDGSIELDTESGAFNRRFRLLSNDRAFASALVDQRMIDWVLTVQGPIGFEVGGRWAMASSSRLVRPEELNDLVTTLRDFVLHIPRVARSLRPAPDPAFE